MKSWVDKQLDDPKVCRAAFEEVHRESIELRSILDGAIQFQFFGVGGRRGDYVLICFNDEAEELPWELQVFTCEKRSIFGQDSTSFETQHEAATEAIRLATTLTTPPITPREQGGLVLHDDALRGARRRAEPK